MPDRIVRDELLTSERYWSCSPEARNLYLSIVLSVDDAARMSGAVFALRTRCMAGTVSHERISAILAELVDCDLVRRYEHGGKPYLFVPRFRQRLRYFNASKHPEPPTGISDITTHKSVPRQTADVLESVRRQSQDERSEVKRSEVKREVQEQAVAVAPARTRVIPENTVRRRATRLAEGWFLPDEWRDWAVKVHGLDPQRAVRVSLDFRDYWHAKAGVAACKLDWLATWRRWVRKECGDA
jgi:hypothetical protein